jgi:hypothetical protein
MSQQEINALEAKLRQLKADLARPGPGWYAIKTCDGEITNVCGPYTEVSFAHRSGGWKADWAAYGVNIEGERCCIVQPTESPSWSIGWFNERPQTS